MRSNTTLTLGARRAPAFGLVILIGAAVAVTGGSTLRVLNRHVDTVAGQRLVTITRLPENRGPA